MVRNRSRKFMRWFENGTYVVLAMVLIVVGVGCARTRKITTTEKTVTYPVATSASMGERTTTTTTSTYDDQYDGGVVATSERTEVATEERAEHPGIISSTFHAIGYVIALPFIIVGGLLKLIFGG